jgi:DNA-binding NarL/FixJ family response regulator
MRILLVEDDPDRLEPLQYAGADDYLVKPTDMFELLSWVQSIQSDRAIGAVLAWDWRSSTRLLPHTADI